MDFSHYASSAAEPTYPATDSIYHLPGSFPTNSPPVYRPVDGGAFVSSYDLYDDRQKHQSMGIGHTEESDMASRSRLTQEQLARLEREFKQRYKPNTEYKRGLAETMGVEYHKINNWFQNRRAKAKHQNPQEPRFDLSTDEEAPEHQTTLFSQQYERMPEINPSSQFSSPEQPPYTSGDYVASLEIEALNEIHQYGNLTDALRNKSNVNPNYSNQGALQTNFSNGVGQDSMWPANNLYDFPMPKVPTPTIVDHDPFEWSPISTTDLSIQPQSHDFTRSHGIPLYLNTIDGHLVGNPSSQTFATTSSEGGDHAALITPPQETSPMPGLNEGIFTRRDSNSSELAENFDTIHLQQSKIGLGLYEHPPHSTPDLVPSTGLATPNISPDTIAAKSPFSVGRDLASRRRRPRPAALQPDSARSFSYTGPSTASPHLRVSSPGTGRLSPVRRIKSTGNNLSVASGRITKPGAMAPQKSPRNFESCFQLEKTPQSQQDTNLAAPTPRASLAHADTSVPSSVHFGEQPPTSWPDYPSQYGAVGHPWDQGVNGNTSLNFAAGLSLPPSPPDQSNGIPPTTLEHHNQNQQFAYHCPPQSAPPHLTTFFDGSSPMTTQNFTPGGWPAPSLTPPEPYRPDQNTAMPLRPSHMLHHSQSGPYTYLPAQQHSFQGYSPSVEPFAPYQHPFSGLSTPVKKELDIKIEKGPPPPKELLQTSQENKVYSFNNSTPNDFAPATNAKK
ncbi:hypothetical protein P7C71_g620, partial [Lecanoromycetidae sp. Uapishka_2]